MAASNSQPEIALTLNQNSDSSSPSHAAAAQPQDQSRSPMKEVEAYFRYDKDRDKPSDVRTALLTVAVLIAAATYQAGLSPPGGVWQDNDPTANPKQAAGVSIMGTNNQFAFGLFVFGNTLGFYFSLYMIDFLTRRFPLRLELTIAMFGIAITYCASMTTISPSLPLALTFNALSFFLPISLPFVAAYLRDSKLASKLRMSDVGCS